MIGTLNRRNPAERSLQAKFGFESLLIALMSASALACSDLADGADSYCLTDGQGLGPECTDGTGNTGPWWCLDQTPLEPEFTPQERAALVLPVVEWSRRLPLMDAGLTAQLCPTGDPTCAAPLTPPIPIQSGLLGPAVQLPTGAAGVPVFEGFDGFIKFDVVPPTPPASDEERFVTAFLYLNGIISQPISQGPPILMFQRRFRQTIVGQAFPGVDVNAVISRGAVAFRVYDCNGVPVENARVELTSGGVVPENILPFRLPASRIPDPAPRNEPLFTQSGGGAGFLNLPDGFVSITAYREDNVRIGGVQLGVVPGQLTVGTVRPDYARTADISGVPALVNGGAAGAGN